MNGVDIAQLPFPRFLSAIYAWVAKRTDDVDKLNMYLWEITSEGDVSVDDVESELDDFASFMGTMSH